ncbi:hypothetical protein EXIGLDRAFT_723769 [Exidia glandulosa HHB12029]|uniref:Uncharacterized protein n=1 Tax=Exidia glandulosa HHB12029 TaxID=1314781 RepID=A0A165EPE2_EXIGL|nr:hypothetical protein EXIGLDRAFT_723769 [Exidia glandulosa HHB12029]
MLFIRRPQALALVALCTLSFTASFYIFAPLESTQRLQSLRSYFGSSSSFASTACPNPLAPPPPRSSRKPECHSLPTNPELALEVSVCFAPDIANQGHFLISRTNAEECAKADAHNPSTNPETNALLKAYGPDIFHFSLDGDHRWDGELDVEYLGQCQYRYPFSLMSAGPFNLTIWWSFSNYRASDETQTMSLQWDLAEYVLQGKSQIVKPPASAAAGCGKTMAIPSNAAWRTATEIDYLNNVPECSRFEATTGHFLRAHWSEHHTFHGFLYQPSGCRWTERTSNVDADPVPIRDGWAPHSVLFWGDSHVRYAYDVMTYVYKGEWATYKRVPAMKALKKTEYIGPVNITFIWDSVLREFKHKMTCENLADFDTIVLGAGHHNLVHTDEDDHDRQWTIEGFGELIQGLAKKFSPDACPEQKMPRIIWMGPPARPIKLALPPKQHPLNNGWKDARVNIRLNLFNERAWDALKGLPGAARVNLYDLSVPFANSFVDQLHMIMTDTQAAFVQELHHKLWLRQPAYFHHQ